MIRTCPDCFIFIPAWQPNLPLCVVSCIVAVSGLDARSNDRLLEWISWQHIQSWVLIYIWLWSFVALVVTRRRLNMWLMGSNPAKMFCFYKVGKAKRDDIALWKQNENMLRKYRCWSLWPLETQLVFFPPFATFFWPNTWWENLLLPTNPPHPQSLNYFHFCAFPSSVKQTCTQQPAPWAIHLHTYAQSSWCKPLGKSIINNRVGN